MAERTTGSHKIVEKWSSKKNDGIHSSSPVLTGLRSALFFRRETPGFPVRRRATAPEKTDSCFLSPVSCSSLIPGAATPLF